MQTNEALKTQIRQALPELLRTDPAFRAFVLELTREVYADRTQTESRFDRMLDELRRDREESARRWDENKREWDENKRKWDESSVRFDRLHEEIMAQAKKHDRAVGALGARWGLTSERAFRDALSGILEEGFGVEVLRIEDWDDEGTVFGRPEQVELDVIITNGTLLICELKSSLSKADMYLFERKARFYERRHNREADRLIAISPMIDPRAMKVAGALGIETYGDSSEVDRL